MTDKQSDLSRIDDLITNCTCLGMIKIPASTLQEMFRLQQLKSKLMAKQNSDDF